MSANTTSAKSTPIVRALAACVRARVPAIVEGNPGQGKTAKIQALTESWGYYFESVVGSNREATDFLGLPVEAHGVQRYTSLDWAVRLNESAKARPEAGSVLFLDEFNTQEDTMKAMLRVLEERFAGPDKFEDNVAILGAMNPISNATDGIPLPPAVANRVIHLKWVFDFDTWVDGFMSGFESMDEPHIEAMLANDASRRANVKASIAQFLRTMPQHRNACPTSDPDAASGPWASVRMWTKAAEVMSHLRADDDEAERLVLFGAVGEAAGKEYLIWRDRNDLYDPMDVLNGTVKVNWSDPRLDRLYALALSLKSIVGESGEVDQWKKALMLMVEGENAGRTDIAWQGARALLQVWPARAKMPASFVATFGDLVDRVGVTTAA